METVLSTANRATKCWCPAKHFQFLWFFSQLTIQSDSPLSDALRRNPPDVGVTSGQKSCTKIIYIVLQTSVGLF